METEVGPIGPRRGYVTVRAARATPWWRGTPHVVTMTWYDDGQHSDTFEAPSAAEARGVLREARHELEREGPPRDLEFLAWLAVQW